MPSSTIRTVLLFGGRSGEHEVSIRSAQSVAATAPSPRIEIIPMYVAKDGRFLPPDVSAMVLAEGTSMSEGDPEFSFELWSRTATFDVILPLIHGTGGEDGTMQGYLDILDLPYIGSDVTASAIGMDKVHMKQAFAFAKLQIVDHVAIAEADWRGSRERVIRSINNALRLPFFVKPANSGSSIGITKVKADADLIAAVDYAFRFDEQVLVERGIDGREIEVSVLGNDAPEASIPGEVIPGHEFYDYDDKYVDTKSSLVIPAVLPPGKTEEIRKLAIAAFRSIGASGFARVDFFVERGTNRIYLNEINTIPGFTSISMYPKLWEATEMKYPRLIERLIEAGLARATRRAAKRASTREWLSAQA